MDIDAGGEAIRRRLQPNEQREAGETVLAANRFVDGITQAWMNIQTHPAVRNTQADTRRTSHGDVRIIDYQMRREAERIVQLQGAQLASWNGVRSHTNRSGLIMHIADYERSGIAGRMNAVIHVATVAAGSASCTLTVAYNAPRNALYRLVALEIIESLQIT